MQSGVASLHAGPALRMQVVPHMAMRPSPVLLALTALLPLTTQELDEAIDRETAENPALERLDQRSCPVCDGDPGRPCPTCRPGAFLVTDRPHGAQILPIDPPRAVTTQSTLLDEARLLLPHEDVPVAEFVIGNLEDNGFLPGGADAVAAQLGIEMARVERVLQSLRQDGPPGIAATDVRECLLLQLDRLEQESPFDETDPEAAIRTLARAIVAEHLEPLARGHFARIARALGATPEDVEAARMLIRTRLWPYPSSGMPGGEPASPVVPDIVLRPRIDDPERLDVEVVDERRFVLRVDPLYRLLSDMAAANGGERREKVRPEECAHVREAVRRAAMFIRSVHDRNRTLRRIAEHVADAQRAFVLDGPRRLRPLTRARVAEAVGVHESTVSRATAGKHVMLPCGKVIPFRQFFEPSLGVQDALRQIVEREDRALSDRELADRLAAIGYRVARRTVAKYRMRLEILPGALRGGLRMERSPA
jgi:RNA polymerase sigma-54 factor